MATNIYIENDNMSDLIDYWNKSINTFEMDLPVTSNRYSNNFSNGFDALKDAGFNIKSIDSYNSDVNNLLSYLRNYETVIRSYVESINDFDSMLDSQMPGNSNADNTTVSKTNIKVEDNISSSNMSNLKNESERIKEKQKLMISKLLFKNNINNQIALKNLKNELRNNPLFDDSRYNITNIGINKLKNNNKKYVIYNDTSLLLNKINIQNMNKYNNIYNKEYLNNNFRYDNLRNKKV